MKGSVMRKSVLTDAVMEFLGEKPTAPGVEHPKGRLKLPGGNAEWQEFKREAEDSIAAIDRRIGAFKVRLEKASSRVRAMYTKDVAALEQKNRELKRKLMDRESATGNS
jgi:hypothetical protein